MVLANESTALFLAFIEDSLDTCALPANTGVVLPCKVTEGVGAPVLTGIGGETFVEYVGVVVKFGCIVDAGDKLIGALV